MTDRFTLDQLKKNKIHGKGTLKVFGGQTYEGKFKKNKFIKKISRKNRTALSIDFKKGITVKNQIKVSGLTKWYPAIIEGGEFKLSKKGELMASQDKKTLDGGGSGGGSGC